VNARAAARALKAMRFKSIIPGVDFPALPNPRGCPLLALQF
jgi:hypothetical protein